MRLTRPLMASDTTAHIDTWDAEKFDLVMIENEWVLVTSVAGSDSLTIVRGCVSPVTYIGSEATAHPAGTELVPWNRVIERSSEHTCAACRYWKPESYLPDSFGECSRITTIDSWETPTGIAVVTTDCAALLVTRNDFGCVLWQSKEPTGEHE